ncbi:hypothetical protein SAFG77S_06300 [Streptomyces afghaniensis]
MNCRAATAFLPKFVGFPSLRGLHSSTVQLRRAPVAGRRAPVRRDSRLERGRTGARATDGPVKCPLDGRSCRSHASPRRSMATVVLQACEVARTHSESPDRCSTLPPDGNLGLRPHGIPGPGAGTSPSAGLGVLPPGRTTPDIRARTGPRPSADTKTRGLKRAHAPRPPADTETPDTPPALRPRTSSRTRPGLPARTGPGPPTRAGSRPRSRTRPRPSGPHTLGPPAGTETQRGARPRCGPRVRWLRLPRRERGRRVSAASAAAATSSTTPTAGRAAAAGVSPVVSAGRAGVSAPGPPAAAAVVARRPGGRPPPATGRPSGSAAAGLRYQRPDQKDSDHRQDDADDHGVTLLPFPPKRPPVGASLLRELGMPAPRTPQSRVEELQSFGGGWPA